MFDPTSFEQVAAFMRGFNEARYGQASEWDNLTAAQKTLLHDVLIQFKEYIKISDYPSFEDFLHYLEAENELREEEAAERHLEDMAEQRRIIERT